MEVLPKKTRRYNRDGSIDSICLNCYATAAATFDEAKLEKEEALHHCDVSAWAPAYSLAT